MLDPPPSAPSVKIHFHISDFDTYSSVIDYDFIRITTFVDQMLCNNLLPKLVLTAMYFGDFFVFLQNKGHVKASVMLICTLLLTVGEGQASCLVSRP